MKTTETSEPKEKLCTIGGQALIEGIMMRSPKSTCIAVRNLDGKIIVEDVKTGDPNKHMPYKKFVFIRGIFNMVESLTLGYKTLMRSAEIAESSSADEEQTAEEVEKGKNSFNWISILAAVLGALVAVVLFLLIPTLIFNWINGALDGTLTSYRALVEGSMKLIIIVGYMFSISFIKDIRRTFMYHGAEHKAIFTYERGEDLIVENVMRNKRFHPRCGTSFLILVILINIVINGVVSTFIPQLTANTIIWVITKLLLIPVIFAIGYELIRLCGKYDNIFTKIIAAPGLWVQRITTKEPTVDMAEVAIASIKAVLPATVSEEKDEIPNL